MEWMEANKEFTVVITGVKASPQWENYASYREAADVEALMACPGWEEEYMVIQKASDGKDDEPLMVIAMKHPIIVNASKNLDKARLKWEMMCVNLTTDVFTLEAGKFKTALDSSRIRAAIAVNKDTAVDIAVKDQAIEAATPVEESDKDRAASTDEEHQNKIVDTKRLADELHNRCAQMLNELMKKSYLAEHPL